MTRISSDQKELSASEREVLEELWKRQDATASELLKSKSLRMPHTTATTILERLYKFGLLRRVPEGRTFRYFPLISEREFKRQAAVESLRHLLSLSQSSSLSLLVELVADHDAHALDALQNLVEKKRKDLRNRDRQ